jgi:hypothetical protein
MSDDETNNLPIKMMTFLTTEIDDEQMELLYIYTKQHTLAELVECLEVAKQTRVLLQTV